MKHGAYVNHPYFLSSGRLLASRTRYVSRKTSCKMGRNSTCEDKRDDWHEYQGYLNLLAAFFRLSALSLWKSSSVRMRAMDRGSKLRNHWQNLLIEAFERHQRLSSAKKSARRAGLLPALQVSSFQGTSHFGNRAITWHRGGYPWWPVPSGLL